MKFIPCDSGNEIVNSAFIKKIYTIQNDEHIGNPAYVYVEAELVDYSDSAYKDESSFATLATFDSDNEDENYRAARAYIAELAGKLNGGDAS